MSKKAQIFYWICLISTFAAIATHVYLTNHHYEFKYGESAEVGICNMSETINCNSTTASAYSEVFGIPISIFGGLINFVLLCLLIGFRFPVTSKETQRQLSSSLLLLSLGIFAVSLIMAFLSYAVLKTVCPACTMTYIFSFISFISLWMMISDKKFINPLDFKLYPAISVFILAFAFFINHNSLKKYGGQERLDFIQTQLLDWKNATPRDVQPFSPLQINSNSEAKVKIVEFADFLCGHCANAYPTLHNFAKSHPDVEFSFQAWPLDGECNSAIPQAEGTRCFLARISQCAGRQNKAWEMQQWIFNNQRNLYTRPMVDKELEQILPELSLNKEELLSCAQSDEVREIIRNQATLGVQLGIQGTPTLYINGKKVPGGFSVPLLDLIYKEITQ